MYYRKYRPQTISELDNERVRETLGKSLLSNNFAHAYLLIGPRGSGKTSAARLIAKVVNCTKRKAGEEPCNKCDSCAAISGGIDLDVVEIDAASNTGVDDIRSLREKVKLAPTQGKYKVYIIDEVHMLSTSAFNALLKTLEEPPQNVIFVLATTDPLKLPETIISRCLVYDFGRISQDEVLNSLRRVVAGEKIKVSDDALEKISELAGGSFRDGQKILQQLAMQSDNITLEHIDSLIPKNLVKAVRKILAFVISGESGAAIKEVEAFIDQQGKSIDLMSGMIVYLRDILFLRSGVSVQTEDINISNEELRELVNKLIEASAFVRESPVPQLPLEMVVAEFSSRHKNGGGVTEEMDQSDEKKTSGDGDSDKTAEAEKTDRSAVGAVSENASEVVLRWPDILVAIKPFNHSLVALLRASRPKEVVDGYLTLEVFYRFHKEKLAEPKNRGVLEKVVSDIIGKEIKVKFVLSEGRNV